jgi:ribonuclease HI
MIGETMIEIYVDGSCEPNPGPGGWGVWMIEDGAVEHEWFGGEVSTTNNRMELTAAIKALEGVPKWEGCKRTVEIFTDSKYLQRGITSWIHGWKRNDWKRGTVKNVDLWQTLDRLAGHHHVKWKWVKGHAGNPGNEKADELAHHGRRSVEDEGRFPRLGNIVVEKPAAERHEVKWGGLKEELAVLMNKYGVGAFSNTPDVVLASRMVNELIDARP